MGVGGQYHAPATLLLGMSPGIHCTRKVGFRTCLGCYRDVLPPGVEMPNRPASSEFLYRMSYLRLEVGGVRMHIATFRTVQMP